jgi:formylglycine-generating enzyme required for sulfatase activity
MIPLSAPQSHVSRCFARGLRVASLVCAVVCGVQAAGGAKGLALETVPVRSFITFSDCPNCSMMVAIPAGRFVMGSPMDEPGRLPDEGPAHTVVIERKLALAVFDVTREEYARFVDATRYAPGAARCDWRNPVLRGKPLQQTPDDPVVCVSWTDATAYVRWLSAKSGYEYRLPTEAEWEYAARAGSTTARPWGADADADRANTGMDECCGPNISGADRWLYTSPVGSFPPNDFGLFDMIGNVWQWTSDCGTADYTTPARSPDSQRCASHMVRGGGWFHPPAVARSASRAADDNDQRVADIGFRIARSL